MPFTVTMPKLTPTMEEGTIAAWSKKEGDFVEAGETIVEIATDKATVEHQALDEGYLRKILVPEGQEAKVGQPIAIFTTQQEESIAGYAPEGVSSTPPAAEGEPAAPVAADGLGIPRRWQRLRSVAGRPCRLEATRTSRLRAGGSSNVLSRLLAAAIVISCAGSMIARLSSTCRGRGEPAGSERPAAS